MANAEHIYVWEFLVRDDRIPEFEAAYRPGGTWTRLFEQADGYVGTELVKDIRCPGRYLTFDRWATIEHYRRYRTSFATEHKGLDADCESFTLSETDLGEYGVVD